MMTMICRALSCAAVLAAMLLAMPISAQEPPAADDTYVLTLQSSATVVDGRETAEQLVRTFGGELIGDAGADRYLVRISGSRARLLVSDARVASLIAGEASVAAAVWNPGRAYAYDGSGNITSIGTDSYTYDAFNRLTTSKVGGVTRTYTYDAFGNRSGCTQDGVSCEQAGAASAATNRMESLTYDSDGNVIGAHGHAYSYDALNMQTRDVTAANTREYVYTADDERIGVYTDGTWWRWSVRDLSGRVLREYTSANGPNGALGVTSWTWSKDYVWREGLLLATRQPQPETAGTTTYFYHLDHLGTPRLITDERGYAVGAHHYHPFGQEAAGGTDEPSLSVMKFTGHERDLVAGQFNALDYMHARYYSSGWGRFLSVDPLGGSILAPQSLNRYTYALNNALSYVDPTGLAPCTTSDPSVEGGRPFPSDCITVEGKVPRVNTVRASVSSLFDLMLWASGRLPRHQGADPASAAALANTPTMESIRQQYKADDCKSESNWSDFQTSEFLGTDNLTGHLVGAFTAKIRPVGNGLVVVHARNTWGLESMTRLPGVGNRGNPSVQDIVGNPQYFVRNMAHGGGAPGYPSSLLNNRASGLMATATMHYSWIEGSPCAN